MTEAEFECIIEDRREVNFRIGKTWAAAEKAQRALRAGSSPKPAQLISIAARRAAHIEGRKQKIRERRQG
ncbi:MAG: hypothetical protein NC541_01910 [bacterium]|nr:hypothetical protein [bacterium]